MRSTLEDRLKKPNRNFTYDREKDSLRIENTVTNKGITVALPPIVSKWQENNKTIIDEVVYYVEEALNVMGTQQETGNKEKKVFPVIRSTSFATESNEGTALITDDHTAETRIYYAIDLGTTYRLMDENMLKAEGWSHDQMKEIALFNVRGLTDWNENR